MDIPINTKNLNIKYRQITNVVWIFFGEISPHCRRSTQKGI